MLIQQADLECSNSRCAAVNRPLDASQNRIGPSLIRIFYRRVSVRIHRKCDGDFWPTEVGDSARAPGCYPRADVAPWMREKWPRARRSPAVTEKTRSIHKQSSSFVRSVGRQKRHTRRATQPLFTEDAVFVDAEGLFSGRQAIDKYYADLFQKWQFNSVITYDKNFPQEGDTRKIHLSTSWDQHVVTGMTATPSPATTLSNQ